MKKIRKIILILITLCLFSIIQLTTVFAETVIQDGLELALETDKTEYAKNEKITVSITIENNSYSSANNLYLENIVPNGYICENGSDNSKNFEKLNIDDSISLTTTYVPYSNQINSNPNTGDSSNIWVYGIICFISGVALVVFFIKSKRKKEVLSIFLCVILSGSLIINIKANVFAVEDNKIQTVNISTKVIIENKEFTINAKVRYDTFPDINIDTDGDYVLDYLEEYLGTDKNIEDTDGDGLSDFIEIFRTETDPLLKDSDNNGISDDLEDADNDGLYNIDEIKYGTDIINEDTDGDGIIDGDEINKYNSNPLEYDTDGDGAGDGWEIKNGYDPLVYNDKFNVFLSKKDENITASISIELTGGQVETLSLEPISSEYYVLFSSDIPGYVGAPFNFEVDGDFDTPATISFEFDSELLNDSSFVPKIYYFNEEIQFLEELETTVVGNVASTQVTHFSTYMLLNQTERNALLANNNIRPPYSDLKGMSISFVLDRSASMSWNDADGLRKTLTNQFIDKLSYQKDLGSVISFIARAEALTDLTNDVNVLKDAVNSITDDSGYGSYSGTNGSAGIHAAIEQLINDKSGNSRYIVFMTDGEDTKVSYPYDDLIKTAKDNDITIYTVGLGSVNAEILKKLADSTGGKYYYAALADELLDVFEEVESETIDYHTDSNEDGISDYYTKLLLHNQLRNGLGGFILINRGNILYSDFQKSDDYDGDGLKNGEEVVVVEKNGYVYGYVHSFPDNADSDGDGLSDFKAQYRTIVRDDGKNENVKIAPRDPKPLIYNGEKGLWAAHIEQVNKGNKLATGYSNEYYQIKKPTFTIKELLSNISLIKKTAKEFILSLTGAVGSVLLDFRYDDNKIAIHSDTTQWQSIGGYNDVYDAIFNLVTDMDKMKLEFSSNGQKYIIWVWKGNYLNLGAGAEIGFYKYGAFGHWVVDGVLPMKLSLYKKNGESSYYNYYNWFPTLEQWWITGFVPDTNDENIKSTQIVQVSSVDFYGKRIMYDAIKEKNQNGEYKNNLIFDDEDMIMWIMW